MNKIIKKLIAVALVVTMATGCSAANESSNTNSGDIGKESSASNESSTSSSTESESSSESSSSESSSTESSSSEPEETPADIPEITGEVSLYEELPFKDREVVCVPGENTFLLKKEDGTYSLVNAKNEPISNPDTRYIGTNYQVDRGFVVLKKLDGSSTAADVFNANGEQLYKDVCDYTDNLVVTKSPAKSDVTNNYGEPLSKYTFTNTTTGQKILSVNEAELNAEGYVNCYLTSNAVGTSVISAQQLAVSGYVGVWVVDATHYVNLADKLKAHLGVPEVFITNVFLSNNSNCLHISYKTQSEKGEIFPIIYNFDADKFIDYKKPAIEGYLQVSEILPDDGMIVYNVYESAENGTMIAAAFDGTLLYKGGNSFIALDDYYMYGYNDKWELIMKDTGERKAFDDATNFWKGYAFVVENGMGHFINTKFEKVSNDIPATGASVFYNSGIIRLSTQGKYYRMKVNS